MEKYDEPFPFILVTTILDRVVLSKFSKVQRSSVKFNEARDGI